MTSENRLDELRGMRDYLGTASKAIEDATHCTANKQTKLKIHRILLEIDELLDSVCSELKE